MSHDSSNNTPLPIIPEHLRTYLITPAAYLEQHKSEHVAHLVVGAVVISNDSLSGSKYRSRSLASRSPIRSESDQTSHLPLASPLSTSSSCTPPLPQDRVFSPFPCSPTSSLSSSPPSSPQYSSSSLKKRTEEKRAAISSTAIAKDDNSYSSQSPLHPLQPTYSGEQQPRRILLVQRSRHDYGGLCWEIPGGSCDPQDTSILDAAARELVEEAGLRVRRFVAVVDQQRHEWVDRGEVWRKLTFIVEAEAEADGVDEFSGEERDERDEEVKESNGRWSTPLRVQLDPEEHEDFVWASREDLLAGGIDERTFTWIQDEQRQVILRAFDIAEQLGG
ncbi:hypothetical protein PG996_003356 [Apiospora saccharicola]|uniref:Nudix hydrolase domain-containing protein n=1 Tax=Apiospora saccharicola TaxID=335842 RepID=A0ABR1W117_9PEZI